MKKFWSMLVCFGFSIANAAPDALTLYFIRTPNNYDWSTPTTAIRYAVESNLWLEYFHAWPGQTPREFQPQWKLAEHQIGHTNVHLQCAGHADFWGGLTDDLVPQQPGDETVIEALGTGGGLEAVLRDHESRFYTEAQIKEQFAQFFHNDRMSMMTILVNHQTCERISRFVNEFKALNHGHPKFGGLATKARFGRGAGCTEFAMALLDVGGLIDPQMETYFSREFWVPFDLLRTKTQKPRVSLLQMSLGEPTTWAAPRAANALHVRFYDPSLAGAWVRWVMNGQMQARDLIDARRERVDFAAPGTPEFYLQSTVDHLTFDRRNTPTPTDPLWWRADLDPVMKLPRW